MGNIQWILGVEPATLPVEWRECVKALFLQETGEVYAPAATIKKLKSTAAGRKKLAAANKKKRAATKKGKQHARHGLHKGKKR